MAGGFRRFIRRMIASGKTNNAAHDKTGAQAGQSAGVPGLHVSAQSVDALRAFNATVRTEDAGDSAAINNLSAREARRAIVTRPIQF